MCELKRSKFPRRGFVLLITQETRLWLWIPTVISILYLPILAEKGAIAFNNFSEEEKNSFLKKILTFIISLIVVCVFIYFGYRILIEMYVVVISSIHSFVYIVSSMFLIWVGICFLSEYLSMKFIISDISMQNYDLFELKTLIDRLEDVDTLEKCKRKILTKHKPAAGALFTFFVYYRLIPTRDSLEISDNN